MDIKTDKYLEYIVEETKKLLAIDSPTGYTNDVAEYCMEAYREMGYTPVKTVKGGVLADLGGKDADNAVLLEAHADTLGAMVAEVKGNGRLRLTPLGGLNPNNAEAENCRVITRFSGKYEGTFQLVNASTHVNGDYSDTKRGFDTMEVVLDEKTESKEETEKLGIMTGDIVAFDPRTVVTSKGYIKSRFLDDKLSTGILLGFARYIREENLIPDRKIYQHITVYEEVGHGACGTVPEGVTEILSVDMGCVGDGLACQEHQVSICAKDSGGPYNYEVVTGLIQAARERGIDFAVDIYPHYGSDADAALSAGYDVKHGLIGAGVYASHGYERSHVDGVKNTFELLKTYLLNEGAGKNQ
ncbi:MAG: M42 family metallopeptidase [Lachnospiraceae bacterium]|nr:M42 family metallopeptidase [Lachnospiraceae bacterium]